jgi:actin-like protein 6A
MLFSEPDMPDKALRTCLAEQFFEQLQVPALYFAPASVLAAFGSGRQSALVIQSGAFSTSAAPVHEGSIIPKSLYYCEIGGETLTYLVMDLLAQRGISVRPAYLIKKELRYKKDSEGGLELLSKPIITALDFPQTHSSYHLFSQLLLIRDLKESLLRVSDTPYSHESAYQNQGASDYELPDGTTVELGAERYRAPEVLFAGPTALADSGVPGFKGIHEMAYEAIQRTEPDIRKDLYSNVIFAGGNTLLAGFPERVLKKLLDMALPTIKVKQVAPVTPAERRFATWQGGSVLASLASFRRMWMTREEYKEHGPCILTRKSAY